ncbi:Crp/Fnr family transcriptional regulator [Streptomyces caniscabiei]|uniref:Crp/Fnr family transcriptional regulator n=1 Tax=Streptomyces caniscabiei TaxID=2746961 RepID=A0A927L7V0_9ACTN|nr:Crp/Fnr family transcriptional regulator [Streptomyces caniscabiei]MBD9702720.1 Crp/Fnr family transcriptional regulator [Streptomyces caniscabiei]MBD9727730.1 Crp/Fnr family transcriptional regulator [Streptomyces caniscabiei]MDX3512857.1 Crp/Fnr family transcriptional regulator [Streptomyces caniscabiei]MDX3721895.1 Crp/Fnr family transcriptional regulator [Streptomyces caniscabiei]MDX3728511.1 Crp/Fnr family transcriptional regulator [Streptomyces caniscabiei]
MTGGTTGTRTHAWDDDGFDDRVPFLARLEKDDRVALLATGRPLRYRARSVIMHQDEPSTHVLLLLHGWTKVTAIAANGYEALLALRGPGDIIGEGAALSGRHRAATVTALEPVEAVVIDQTRFTAFLAGSPQVSLQLLGLSTDRQRSTDRRRLEWAALTVRERLAVLLLELVRTHGTRTDEGIELTIGLSQQEFAGSVGSSREAVARLLKELRTREVVVTRRRRIVVLRPDVLRRIIGEGSA